MADLQLLIEQKRRENDNLKAKIIEGKAKLAKIKLAKAEKAAKEGEKQSMRSIEDQLDGFI